MVEYFLLLQKMKNLIRHLQNLHLIHRELLDMFHHRHHQHEFLLVMGDLLELGKIQIYFQKFHYYSLGMDPDFLHHR
jgi:hypothetical protein